MWLLGHKFVPYRTNPRHAEKEIENEVKETIRKIGWKMLLGETDYVAGPVPYKKGSELPEHPLSVALIHEAEHIALQAKREQHLYWEGRHIPTFLTTGAWRAIFKTCSGRWMVCDKNLGVRNVPEEEFVFLQMREAAKYVQVEELQEGETSVKGHDAMCDFVISNKVKCLRELAMSHLPEHQNHEKGSLWHEMRKMILHSTLHGKFKVPKLKLLLKVHKPKKDGHYQTRPIVPSCGLPDYHLSQWVGSLLARYSRSIPWVLDCTEDFILWLRAPSRTRLIKTFDFTNLFGTEPVIETMKIFAKALEELPYAMKNMEDQHIWVKTKQVITVPEHLQQYIGKRAAVLVVLTTMCVAQTIATIDVGTEERLLYTNDFLAMGVSPVAPLSNITLAYLEWKTLGRETCEIALKRFIDDIIIDEGFLKERSLRRIYEEGAPYLTLNESTDGHFLDVSYYWNEDNKEYAYWLYVKPYPTVPLNFYSNHPPKCKISAARNELKRILARTNIPSSNEEWTIWWYKRYRLALYPENVLLGIIRNVCEGWKWCETKKYYDRNVTRHVERWRGFQTETAEMTQFMTTRVTQTAWSVGQPLKVLGPLLCARKEKLIVDVDEIVRSYKLLAEKKHGRSKSFMFPLFKEKKKTPEDGQEDSSSSKGLGKTKKWESTRRRSPY